jgi:hypothetical protein
MLPSHISACAPAHTPNISSPARPTAPRGPPSASARPCRAAAPAAPPPPAAWSAPLPNPSRWPPARVRGKSACGTRARAVCESCVWMVCGLCVRMLFERCVCTPAVCMGHVHGVCAWDNRTVQVWVVCMGWVAWVCACMGCAMRPTGSVCMRALGVHAAVHAEPSACTKAPLHRRSAGARRCSADAVATARPLPRRRARHCSITRPKIRPRHGAGRRPPAPAPPSAA